MSNMISDHCQQHDKFEKYSRSFGTLEEAVSEIKKDINALFDQSREQSTQSRKILEAVNDLKLKTALETRELKIKYGFFGSLVTVLSTLLGGLSVWFFKR